MSDRPDTIHFEEANDILKTTLADRDEEIADITSSKSHIMSVDAATEDLYEEESPETDQTFELALWVLAHQKDIRLDPDLHGDEAEVASNLGVVEGAFGGPNNDLWKIEVNWNQYEWAGKMPPGYCRVRYADIEVGIIGPWLTIRTCWSCGLKGWRDGMKGIGNVLPGVECPHCNKLDWFGVLVTPEQFIRDAAEFIANDTGANDDTYEMMAGKYA